MRIIAIIVSLPMLALMLYAIVFFYELFTDHPENIKPMIPELTPPKATLLERFFSGSLLLVSACAVITLCSALCGCYSNTGSATAVGDITALPEISDAADNLCVKVYYSMTGARVWTAKDSLVKITYANDYTNSYCGVIDTRGNQRLSVEIEPLSTDEAGASSPSETSEDSKENEK